MIHILIDHSTILSDLFKTITSLDTQEYSKDTFTISIINRTLENVKEPLDSIYNYGKNLNIYLEGSNRNNLLNEFLNEVSKTRDSFYDYILFIKSGCVLTSTSILSALNDHLLNSEIKPFLVLPSKYRDSTEVFINPYNLYYNLFNLNHLRSTKSRFPDKLTFVDNLVFLARFLEDFNDSEIYSNFVYRDTCCFSYPILKDLPSKELLYSIDIVDIILTLKSMLINDYLKPETSYKKFLLLEATIVMFTYYMYSLKDSFINDERTKVMCKSVLKDIISFEVVSLCFDRYDVLIGQLKSVGGDIDLASFTTFLKDMDMLGLKYAFNN